jgi:hypothetical protein
MTLQNDSQALCKAKSPRVTDSRSVVVPYCPTAR